MEGQQQAGASWQFKRVRLQKGMNFFSHGTAQYEWWLLLVFILLVYAPYLGGRVVRPAGDDKVYVSQAVEMAKHGSWFLQTLADVPNYYKGPLHYILLKIGIWLFGYSMWATVYMNLALTLVASVMLGKIVQRNMRAFGGWDFWVGMAFAVNAGIYAHMFASQMEVEAASFMVIGLYYLDRSGPGTPDLKFWLTAGLLGWLKSPLHAVFLGTTAILFWGWNRELIARVKSPKAWLAAFLGIALCALGYAPAFFLDHDNFVQAYVYRETLWKPANGAPWHYPVIPFFTYYLMPWMLPAFVAYLDVFTRSWRRQRLIQSTPGSRRVQALGICLMIPSLLFFMWHPYRGQNYDLPVIGGLLLVVAATWATRAASWDWAYQSSIAITALLMIAVVSALTYFTRHFDPMPFWWSSWRLPTLWLGFFVTARGFWREGVTFRMLRPDSLARRSLWLFLTLGGLLTILGEREMIDVRDRLYQATKDSETLTVSYYNLQHNIWSEWGYLNFMIPYPVQGIHSEAQLEAAAKRNDLILVPGDEWLADMHAKLDKLFPPASWKVEPWKRWKTKGKNAEGVPAWKEAWDSRDLSKLEKNFYMVRVSPGPAR